jgi:sugar-specific transcriptional regulator TrmB
MNNELLISLGLTQDEATIYNVLLEGGFMPARTVATRASLGRPLTYKILDDLIIKNIIEKKDTAGKISLFAPIHPRELEKLLEKKKEVIETVQKTLNESIGQMVSKYNLFIGKPNVQFYEGKDGLLKIYEDINIEKNDILLIQSPFDSEIPEIDIIVQNQIKKQVANNIHTKAITPYIKTTKEWVKNKDLENLVTRCIIPEKKFEVPAQILIYGNKIGISSVRNPFITTIIEDKNINDTFRIMFDYIWNISQEKHREIMNSFDQQDNSQKV